MPVNRINEYLDECFYKTILKFITFNIHFDDLFLFNSETNFYVKTNDYAYIEIIRFNEELLAYIPKPICTIIFMLPITDQVTEVSTGWFFASCLVLSYSVDKKKHKRKSAPYSALLRGYGRAEYPAELIHCLDCIFQSVSKAKTFAHCIKEHCFI